jgi:hypothetical protein
MSAKEQRLMFDKKTGKISVFRAFIIAALFFVVSNMISLHPPFLDPLGVMIVSIALMALLQSVLGKRFGIRPQEAVVVYAFYSFAMVSSAFLRPLLDIVSYTSFQILGDVSGYGDVAKSISPVLLVQDLAALMPVFTGGESVVQWGQWIVPLVLWCVIFRAMAFLFLALSSLSRNSQTNSLPSSLPSSPELLANIHPPSIPTRIEITTIIPIARHILETFSGIILHEFII